MRLHNLRTVDMQPGAAENTGGLHGNGHDQTGARASRPAGGEPVQGDPVRESGVIISEEGL